MPDLDYAWLAATFSAVFFVVDPIAVVPLFVAMTPDDDRAKRARTATRACLVAAVVLGGFALGGGLVFKALGLTLPAFQIAGGILLLMTALDELQTRTPSTRTSAPELAEGAAKDDISIVPLAMPLLAGPGAIATVMVLMANAREPWQTAAILGCIATTCLIAWVLLRMAEWVDRVLGATVRAIVGRVTGLLLAAVGVQFVVSGLTAAFPLLAK